ncbi:hypothetical protein GCM10009111_27070 [Colwellia asteriadis]|uniref:Uncharacterized protein n=1 Tax=Colwellia asteriadis TaxID=517723 RepID=A0ABN1L9C5_9GAMM
MWIYKLTLIINVICMVLLSQDNSYSELNYLFIPALVLSLFGLVYKFTNIKFFGYMAMFGLVVFLPIGFLGIYSIREAMDKQNKLNFIRKLENDGYSNRKSKDSN